VLPYNIYPRNMWYVAAFAADLQSGPLARRVCDQPIVLFRSGTGTVAALEDRCIHRGMPLSQGGECAGEIIRCPYHGLEYDATGQCTKIPGQDKAPPSMRIESYPVVERDALIWIWTGEAAKADPGAIPAHSYHSDPAWAWSPVFLEIQCDWQLLHDNLLDLTHLAYVHRKTIGGDPDAHTTSAEMKTTRKDKTVLVTRWLRNSNPPPFYKIAHTFPGKIDRWQDTEFVPGLIRIWSGGTDAGTGAFEGKRDGGVQLMGLHAVTPSTATSCYYHFTVSRNFKLGVPEVHSRVHEGARATLLEDKAVLEIQQERVLEEPKRPLVDTRWDAGGLQARRIIETMVAAEAAA